MSARPRIVSPDATTPASREVDTTPLASTNEVPHEAEPTVYEAMDRAAHAAVAKATSGIAPSVLAEAWIDWAVHLAVSPGKQLHLMEAAMRNAQALWGLALGAPPADPDAAPDRRFADDRWRKYPFSVWTEAHLMNWQWWQDATKGVHGVAPSHEDLMSFVTAQMVDMTAPSNFPATNPDVISATLAQGGRNLARGAKTLAEDMAHQAGVARPDGPRPFAPGRNLAVTPGKVVFRNDLIELIQYAPTTGTVYPEPILIVPAWIMKYYILDLSPQNSMVRYLVSQGFTVFMVSWRNPDADDRALGMDDYRQLGVMEAVDAVETITAQHRIHAIGYCLGGTLLSIAASAMGRDGDQRLASVSFLAAQVDFTEAGPLRLFINEFEVTLIEDMMAETGYLSSDQMAGAFALLRARDLIWAPAIKKYLLGQSSDSFDLMAWNEDATRMPYRMHSEYLRRLFLNNDLTEGRYHVGEKAISVADIRAPMFVVGTEDDHVAPWRSVYKFHLFADVDITFVLTSGGHNAGIVSEPGHRNRHFRVGETPATAAFRAPSEWLAETEPQDGSWWIAFTDWLAARSGEPITPPRMGARSGHYAAICDAPGAYVMQR